METSSLNVKIKCSEDDHIFTKKLEFLNRENRKMIFQDQDLDK